MKYILKKEDLIRLQSNRDYQNLKAESYHCDDKDAVSLKSQLYESINHDIYNEIINALCKVSFINKDNSDCKETCDKFYLWIGNILFNELKKDNDFSNIIQILNKLSLKFLETHKCSCNFYNNMNKSDFNKVKNVYDYIVDYSSIDDKLKLSDKLCDKGYKAYLDERANIYEEVYSDCLTSSSHAYCSVALQIIPKFYDKKLTALTCTVDEDLLKLDNSFESQYNMESTEYSESTTSKLKSFGIFISLFFPFLGITFYLLYK
ncbi:Plasmodium vivax Vir protein, putative, partial [Plasmodium ovale]